ncbi:MAG: hypothetical protein ACRDL5_11260 [Solirubrobacteraceae bacterium]
MEVRRTGLEAQLADTEGALAANPQVPRLFMLEEEYRRAMLQAELSWVRGVIEDVRAGRLAWSEQWIAEIAAQIGLSSEEKGVSG